MSVSINGSVLVTGGTGLIGAHVARHLLANGITPILFDLTPSDENIADIRERTVVERGDVSDMNDLLEVVKRHRVTRVIHLAAVLTMQSGLQPSRVLEINCVGTSNIFLLAKVFDMQRVVYASTAAVYGSRLKYQEMFGRNMVSEDDPVMPNNLYGSTKVMCEGLATQEIRGGSDIVGLRPVVTFGVGRLSGAVGILNTAIRDAAQTGRGVVTRPWLAHSEINPMYVEDCADAFVRTCLWPERLHREVYNLGTGEYWSMRKLMDMATSLMPGASIEFENVTSVEGRGMNIPAVNLPDLDSSALRNELKWTPAYGVESGVREWIQSYKSSNQPMERN